MTYVTCWSLTHWEWKCKICCPFNNWGKVCRRYKLICSTLVDQAVDVITNSLMRNLFKINKLKLKILKLNLMDHAQSNQPSHNYEGVIFFGYVCFRKFSFIPFVGIRTWKKSQRKREVGTGLGNHINSTKRHLVHSRRLSFLTLHSKLYMSTAAISTCLIIVQSLEYQYETCFHKIHSPISLVLQFHPISLKNLAALPPIKKFKKTNPNSLYLSLSLAQLRTFKCLKLLFLLENFL